jgi:NADPH:quinone reductase-like Zn-dependent oxidoreductase
MSEGDYLRQVAELAGQGKFRINIDKSYPLAEAGAAQEYNREGHTEGKVILIVKPDGS